MAHEKQLLLASSGARRGPDLVKSTVAQVLIGDQEIAIRFEDGRFIWLTAEVNQHGHTAGLWDYNPVDFELAQLGVETTGDAQKKQVDYYLSLDYPVVVQKLAPVDGGGYIAMIPQLGTATFVAAGDTADEAYRNLDELRQELIPVMVADGVPLPLPLDPRKAEENDSRRLQEAERTVIELLRKYNRRGRIG